MTATELAPATNPLTHAPAIRASGIVKSFGHVQALAGADLTVGHGELVALVGPSGSGKTTLLRTIAGFEVPDHGTIWIGDAPVVGDGLFVEPDQRGVGMVFQDGALFPHLTVRDNVGFGCTSRERVMDCLELVGLADRADDWPHELSGGERQRIALARALAPNPPVVLLDEPFASLDPALRASLREEVTAILREADAGALLVTHDQEDALAVADTVAVMHDGRIEQVGTPVEVYRRPQTRWVADFIGDADILPGVAHDGVISCALGRVPCGRGLEGAVDVVLRPESLVIEPVSQANGHRVEAQVIRRLFFGHDQLVWVRLATGEQIRCREADSARWQPGDAVCLHVRGEVHVLPTAAAAS